MRNAANVFSFYAIIAIEHGFSMHKHSQGPKEVLKTAASGLGFQHLPRDLAKVNAWKTMFDPYSKASSGKSYHRPYPTNDNKRKTK